MTGKPMRSASQSVHLDLRKLFLSRLMAQN